MPRGKRGSKVFGIVLIFIGVMWLIREMGYRDVLRGELGMWAMAIFGTLMLLNGYRQNRRGLVFWGSFLTLLGAVNIFQEFRIIHPYLVDVWPLYLGSIGVAFLTTIPLKPIDYASAIPGFIFIAAGLYLFMEVNDYLPYGLFYGERTIPALFLILMGVLLVWKNSRRKKEDISSTDDGKEVSSKKANI